VTRAGTTTPSWWGSSITPKQANYDGRTDPYEGGGSKGEYRQRTVPIDSFEPNPWGLYNVLGNVWEWTEDCCTTVTRATLVMAVYGQRATAITG
jgi:formylglycine-generating enzyme required for sulfatase activity